MPKPRAALLKIYFSSSLGQRFDSRVYGLGSFTSFPGGVALAELAPGLLALADEDGNRQISLDELVAAVEVLYYPPPPELVALVLFPHSHV